MENPTGVMQEKARQKEQDAMTKNCAKSGRTAWVGFIMSAIENLNVSEHQHVNGYSNNKRLQDVTTKAAMAMDAISDPLLVSNANICRGLQKAILLSKTVNYQCADGTMRPMTFCKGRGC